MSNLSGGVINQLSAPTAPANTAQQLESVLSIVHEQSTHLSNLSESLCSRLVGSTPGPAKPPAIDAPHPPGTFAAITNVLERVNENLINALNNLNRLHQETTP